MHNILLLYLVDSNWNGNNKTGKEKSSQPNPQLAVLN